MTSFSFIKIVTLGHYIYSISVMFLLAGIWRFVWLYMWMNEDLTINYHSLVYSVTSICTCTHIN